MANKRCQITMGETTEFKLKYISSKCGKRPGELLGLILDGIDNRLDKVCVLADVVNRNVINDGKIILAILDADKFVLDDDKLIEIVKSFDMEN